MKGIEDYLIKVVGLYESLPSWIQKIAGWGYNLLPQSYRLGDSVQRFEKLIKESEKWSPEEIKDFQEKKFLQTITAAKKTKFYPKFYKENGIDINSINSIDQLKDLPFLTKELIQEHLDDILVESQKSQAIFATTGGSSGSPSGFYLQKGVSRGKELAFIENIWSQLGYKRGDKCAVIRGKITSANGSDKIFKIDYVRKWLFLSSYHLTPDYLEDFISELNKFKPKFIQGYPSSLYLLAQLLLKSGKQLKFNVEGIFAGSENIDEYQIKTIEKAFDSKLITWYGHSEVIVLGGFCSYQNKYHIFPQYGIMELVNENGDEVHDGRGEIVGTNFDNEVFPMIRFKTKDFALRKKQGMCGCGRRYDLLDEIEGRAHEFIIVENGRKVSLTAVNMHDDTFENVKQYQFIQTEENKVLVKYISISNAFQVNEQRMRTNLQSKLGSTCEIQIECVDSIALSKRGKEITLIQELKIV